jgi:HAMP domain-containing protein
MEPISPKKSLAGKFARYLLIFLVFFLLAGFVTIYLIKAEFERSITAFQSYKVNEEAEAVDGKIQSIVNDLRSFYVLKDDMAKKDFALTTTHIYQLFLVTKAVEDVHVINPEGFEVLGVSQTGLAAAPDLRDLREAPYFKIAKAGKIYVGEIKLSGQDAYTEIAVPYFENFKLVGVVFAMINFKDYFGELAFEGALGYHHLHILDKNGIILASPNLRLIGKDVSASALFQKLKTQADGLTAMTCDECTEAGEFQVITAAERIKHPLGLYVVLESDPAQALAFYYRARNIFMLAAGILIIFYIVLVWMLSARLRRRFQVLTEGIDRFHRGDYTQKITLHTGDELEYIAEHINHFVKEIDKGIVKQSEMLRRLGQTDIVKYNFIKNISHQLRTPITSMLWLLENLTDQLAGALTKEQNSLFQDIYKAIQNINRITNDMITMVDVDEGRLSLEVVSTNLGAVFDAAVHEVQALAAEKGVAIAVKNRWNNCHRAPPIRRKFGS